MKRKQAADIFDVARVAGVSISTVSRCFNHPNLVKAPTRKRIDDAIKSTGYIRNRAAQSIQGRRSGTIGLIVPTIEHTIFAEMVEAFSERLEEDDYSIILASHNYDLKREYSLLRKMLEHRVDGVGLIGQKHQPETMGLIELQDMPTISVWNFAPDSPTDCVGASNFEAGYVACEHLLALGHRRLDFVFPAPDGNDRAADRLLGAQQALADHGLQWDEQMLALTRYSVRQAKSDCMKLLSHSSATAMLCGNDVIGRGAVLAALELGIKVPDARSIMSIGDFKGSAEFVPSLSTVRIPSEIIGREAAHLLLDRIKHSDKPLDRRKIPLELIQRQSTAIPA